MPLMLRRKQWESKEHHIHAHLSSLFIRVDECSGILISAHLYLNQNKDEHQNMSYCSKMSFPLLIQEGDKISARNSAGHE